MLDRAIHQMINIVTYEWFKLLIHLPKEFKCWLSLLMVMVTLEQAGTLVDSEHVKIRFVRMCSKFGSQLADNSIIRFDDPSNCYSATASFVFF